MRRMVGVVLVLAVAACSTTSTLAAPTKPEPLANQAWGAQDPKPADTFATSQTVHANGGVVRNDFVTVSVPDGALGSATSATVSLGTPLGRTDGPYAKESWGAPVRIDHTAPLTKPVTLSWDVSRLTNEQRASIVLVRWDPAHATWATTGEPLTIRDGTLSTQVSHFSIVDWISNSAAGIGQTFGQWTGKRAQAPTCSKAALPSWVKSVVRPDENLSASAIRTCVEPDTKSGGVTVRVADNRSYTQHLSLAPADAQWAWVWNGETDYSPLGSAWDAAHAALDSRSRALIPATKTMAFGVTRPTTPGAVRLTMAARSDVTTIFVDLISMTIDNMSVGGLDNPVANAFAQALYECGGKSLLQSRPSNAKDAAKFAMGAARGCVSAILGTGSSELSNAVMTAFESSLRAEVAKGGASAQNAIKAGRLAREISSRLWYLKLFEAVEYVSNQLADSLVGPTTVTLHLAGTPQTIGSWTATCSDPVKDSNLLYQNLALQDQFTDKSKEYWQFPNWVSATTAAIKPLAKCSTAHQQAVAKNVDSSWADHKSAAVVSTAIRNHSTAAVPGAGVFIGMGLCGQTCAVTGHVSMNHPKWGSIVVVTALDQPDGGGAIAVFNSAGKVVWKEQVPQTPYYRLAVANPARDGTGNIFINYDPGRYNGVHVLRPTTSGFDVMADMYGGTLAPVRFYSAELVGPGADGLYTLKQSINDCTPSCAGGTITDQMYYWNGSKYVPR